jgi:hypothetical protein
MCEKRMRIILKTELNWMKMDGRRQREIKPIERGVKEDQRDAGKRFLCCRRHKVA